MARYYARIKPGRIKKHSLCVERDVKRNSLTHSCYFCGQLQSQLKQNQVRWKAAHDKWVSQDNAIKNRIADV